MGIYVTVSTQEITPSQNFLKPGTIKYILDCIEAGKLDELPPSPIVRQNPDGLGYIAIDGHNLIAVRDYRGDRIEVYVANAADDVIVSDQAGMAERNKDLHDKFDVVVQDAEVLVANGLSSFAQLTAKYPELFAQA